MLDRVCGPSSCERSRSDMCVAWPKIWILPCGNDGPSNMPMTSSTAGSSTLNAADTCHGTPVAGGVERGEGLEGGDALAGVEREDQLDRAVVVDRADIGDAAVGVDHVVIVAHHDAVLVQAGGGDDEAGVVLRPGGDLRTRKRRQHVDLRRHRRVFVVLATRP